jgi:hypothetical protein
MTNRLERLMTLAQKTGSPLIIHDPNSDSDMVLMSVHEYELLVSAHEEFDVFDDDVDWHSVGDIIEQHHIDTAPTPSFIEETESVFSEPESDDESFFRNAVPPLFSSSWSHSDERVSSDSQPHAELLYEFSIPKEQGGSFIHDEGHARPSVDAFDMGEEGAATHETDEPIFFEEPV